MKSRLVTQKDYDLIIEREAVVLPGMEFDKDVKLKAFKEWFRAHRNCSIILEDDNGKIIGFVAAIVCSSKGLAYIQDKSLSFDEYELLGENLINEDDTEASIHIYMIEKLDKSFENFTEVIYKEVFKVLKSKRIKLVGLTGLVASIEANFVALHKLWRSEIKPSNEYLLENANGERKMMVIETQRELDMLLNDGYKIISRTILSGITREYPSVIWHWFEKA